MVALFKALSDWIYKLEKVLVNIILTVMLVSLVLGVFFRYVLNNPLQWSGEFAIFALVWVTFIGGSMSIKTKKAVAVTILTEKLKGTAQKIVIGIGLFACAVFTIFFSYLSIRWIMSPNILLQKTDSIQFPMIIPYSSVTIGILFMTIHSIHLFLECLRTPHEKVIE